MLQCQAPAKQLWKEAVHHPKPDGRDLSTSSSLYQQHFRIRRQPYGCNHSLGHHFISSMLCVPLQVAIWVITWGHIPAVLLGSYLAQVGWTLCNSSLCLGGRIRSSMLSKKPVPVNINDWVGDGSARRGPHFLDLCTVNFRLKLELHDMGNFSHSGDCVMWLQSISRRAAWRVEIGMYNLMTILTKHTHLRGWASNNYIEKCQRFHPIKSNTC